MYTRPTTPRTIGGVLDDAFSLMRACLLRSWPLALAPEVVLALLDIGLQSRLPRGASTDPAALLALAGSPAFAWSMACAFTVMLTFTLALTDHMHAIASARPASPWSSLGKGLRLLPRALATAVLVAVATAVGFLLLIVPGVYLSGAWLLSFTTMVIGDTGPLESMRDSGRLIKGNWWRATTTYTVAAVVALALYFSISLLVALTMAPAGPAGAILVGMQRLISVVLGTIATMWFPAVLLSQYYDLRLRHGGAELAGRTGEPSPH